LVPTLAFLISLERVCTKDYSYDNGRIKIKKGQVITIPTYVLHHSEEYYPDPEKFDPERYRKHLKDYLDLLANLLVYIFFFRWTPENKAKRNPYSYMAFGTGPRNCIGMRFAMEELKMALCSLVQKFRFFPVEETPVQFISLSH
jgi:cytochrome P450 family 3 subfamily A